MRVKTSELSGIDLDWAVGQAHEDADLVPVAYSTDWAQGGPIIEKERLSVVIQVGGDSPVWHASCPRYLHHGYAATPLLAAMRCYVASKLGDEVDLPDNEFLEREV